MKKGALRVSALGGVIACVVACTSNADAPSPPPGCGEDSSVSCAVGVGWSCPAGDDPEAEQSGVSCSVPAANGPDDDFCCFEWTPNSTCTPDDGLTSVCKPGSFGYRCLAGDNPSSLDSSLNCSNPTPDGQNDDFCCQ